MTLVYSHPVRTAFKLASRSVAIACLLLAPVGLARSEIMIYQHDFGGPVSAPLHGQSPDIDSNGGGNAWQTRTDTGDLAGTGVFHYADGSMQAGPAGGPAGAEAMLAFAPASGNVYMATLSIGSVTATAINEWLGFGFAGSATSGTGTQAQFLVDSNPWMLYRGNDATARDQVFLGPGPAVGADWSSPVVSARGSAVDLRIVLDTTDANWVVEWLAKAPADSSFTSLGTTSYTTNPTIQAVGYTVSNTAFVGGKINSFTLTTAIPEPSSFLLVVMGVAMLAPARRRPV
jgi:hypothetical protein